MLQVLILITWSELWLSGFTVQTQTGWEEDDCVFIDFLLFSTLIQTLHMFYTRFNVCHLAYKNTPIHFSLRHRDASCLYPENCVRHHRTSGDRHVSILLSPLASVSRAARRITCQTFTLVLTSSMWCVSYSNRMMQHSEHLRKTERSHDQTQITAAKISL